MFSIIMSTTLNVITASVHTVVIVIVPLLQKLPRAGHFWLSLQHVQDALVATDVTLVTKNKTLR